MAAIQHQPYVASLTGLRGLAALAVYLFHYAHFNPGIRLDLSVPLIGKALHTPFAFGFTGVYWGSRIGKLLCANWPVYYLGLISYSLYLWHFVVLQQLDQYAGETYKQLAGLLKFLLSTVLVILV